MGAYVRDAELELMEETERREGVEGDDQVEAVTEFAASLAESLVKETSEEKSEDLQSVQEESSDWPIPCSSGCHSHHTQSTEFPSRQKQTHICWTPDTLASPGHQTLDTCRPDPLSVSLQPEHEALVFLPDAATLEEGSGGLRRGLSVPQVNTSSEPEKKGGFLRHFGVSRGRSAERQTDTSSVSERSGKKRTGVRGFLSKSTLTSLFRVGQQGDRATEGSKDTVRQRGRLWRLPGLGKGKTVPPCQRALPPVPPRILTSSQSETEGETDSLEGRETGGLETELLSSSASPLIPPAAETDNNLDFASSIERVKDHGWYWGPLSGEAAERILTPEPDGSFIVRDSSDHHYIFSLTFKLNGFVRHVRIEHDQGNFSFGSFTKFKSTTIVEFIENAVEHSRSGRFLFFLHRRPVLGPMRVQLLHPVSRFKRVQSLKHLCRYIIVKHVRKDHLNQLPVPKLIKTYLNTPFYYSEQVTEESDTEDQSFARNWGISPILNTPASQELSVEATSLEALAASGLSSDLSEPSDHQSCVDSNSEPVLPETDQSHTIENCNPETVEPVADTAQSVSDLGQGSCSGEQMDRTEVE